MTETEQFRAALKEHRWADAADLVRRHINGDDYGHRGQEGDSLADWLENGDPATIDTTTPEDTAREWDAS